MRIRRAVIRGFRSFGPEDTALDFGPGLTSILGAPGSGKSSALGAIAFALGEGRPRALGAASMRGLVHGRGTGHARVSVLIDNTDLGIPVASGSVEIAREMDARGAQAYYINGMAARRGRIRDLMAAARVRPGIFSVVRGADLARMAGSGAARRRAIEALPRPAPAGARAQRGPAPPAGRGGGRGRPRFAGALGLADEETRRAFSALSGGSARLGGGGRAPGEVSYEVRMPGARWRESASLRGGERALAGLAFALAVQRLGQSPLCMLDEVDALLDSRVTCRLPGLLARRSFECQFIAAASSAPMADAAGTMYGVYVDAGRTRVLIYERPPAPSR